MEEVGLDSTAVDPSIHPCTDFYGFACGGWLKTAELAPETGWWVRSFSEIRERNVQQLKSIAEDAARKVLAQEDIEDLTVQQVGAFYSACMDQEGADERKTKPVRPILEKIREVVDATSLAKVLAELHRYQVWPFFELRASQDFGDATQMIGVLDQAGLGLPDKTYYLSKTSKEKQRIRDQYFQHIVRMMKLLGMLPSAASTAANEVLRIEISLAKVSKDREERRDPVGMYHKIGINGVRRAAPKFAWLEYLEALGYPGIKDITVTAPLFLTGLNKIVSQASSRALQNYLRWHVLREFAEVLSSEFVDEHHAFQEKLGRQLKPRWKYCLDSIEEVLVGPIASIYVEKHFSGEKKNKALQIFHAIRDVFAKNLASLDWMDEETKAGAIAKLQKLNYLVGYPTEWGTYPIDITSDHTENIRNWSLWETEGNLSQIGEMVDRRAWEVNPVSVSAYYHPLKNQMVFSAGVLQPPFYAVDGHIPTQMGSLGTVVGHEFTHGFDAQGSQFDGNGNLEQWWSEASRSAYEARAMCFEKQFSEYEPVNGAALNGKLTLLENVADLGGVKLAYEAYRQMREGAEKVVLADGFTEDQQFFLANAQVWCVLADEAELLQRIQVDPHADARSRVNGTLSNFTPFAAAFACEEETPMRSTSTCELW